MPLLKVNGLYLYIPVLMSCYISYPPMLCFTIYMYIIVSIWISWCWILHDMIITLPEANCEFWIFDNGWIYILLCVFMLLWPQWHAVTHDCGRCLEPRIGKPILLRTWILKILIIIRPSNGVWYLIKCISLGLWMFVIKTSRSWKICEMRL